MKLYTRITGVSTLLICLIVITVIDVNAQYVFNLQSDSNKEIIRIYPKASQRIYIAANVITNKNIINELVAAKKRGVDVKVLLDERQALGNKYSLHYMLLEADVEVWVIKRRVGLIVSDFGVIDEEIAYTGGSYLHSDLQASPKLGFYLVFHGNRSLVDRFEEGFMILLKQSVRIKN